MSQPLSAEQFQQPETGMFGAPRGRIRPRGSYTVMGVGDPTYGYAGYGYYWNAYPAMVSGQQGDGGVSTQTGVPIGTPSEDSMGKVGGGNLGADSDNSPTQGMSQGGTAAY
jgi:hypothetical protein